MMPSRLTAWSAVAAAIALSCSSPSTASEPGSGNQPAPVASSAATDMARWASHGPPGGTVTALAVNPSDSNFMYAGTDKAGVFKSLDAGRTWSSASAGLGRVWHQQFMPVRALVIDPSDPRIVFAAARADVFKTTDGGGHWIESGQGLGTAHINALVMDPTTPSVLYAGTSEGVFRTSDAAASWDLTNADVRPDALVLDPTNPMVMYSVDQEILKSVDGGQTWEGLGVTQAQALVIDPVDPDVLYAASWPGVAKTIDGGATWTEKDTGLTGEFVSALAIDPSDPNVLYAGNVSVDYGNDVSFTTVFKTLDGAEHWTEADAGLGMALNGDVVFAFDPTAGRVFAGTNVGVFETIDRGATWTESSDGLSDVETNLVVVDPAAPGNIYASTGAPTLDTAVASPVYRSTDGGRSWSARSAGLSLPVLALALNPQDSQVLYAGTYRGVFETTDGGGSWTRASRGLHRTEIDALAVSPSNPNVLYAGGYGLYRSTNAGRTWRVIGGVAHGIVALVVSPRDEGTVYAGTYSDGLWKTSDGGRTWHREAPHLLRYIHSLAIDPQRPRVAYVTTGTVFKTTDGGKTWEPAWNRRLPFGYVTLAVDPVHPRILYAGVFNGGACYGVLRSTDRGIHWRAINDGLDNRCVYALAVDSRGLGIHAATAAGVFDLVYESATVAGKSRGW
jgi:photosystem II stability/assembly factor-like uncharacterized protein